MRGRLAVTHACWNKGGNGELGRREDSTYLFNIIHHIHIAVII